MNNSNKLDFLCVYSDHVSVLPTLEDCILDAKLNKTMGSVYKGAFTVDGRKSYRYLIDLSYYIGD